MDFKDRLNLVNDVGFSDKLKKASPYVQEDVICFCGVLDILNLCSELGFEFISENSNFFSFILSIIILEIKKDNIYYYIFKFDIHL